MASLPPIAALLKASTVPCGLLLVILLLNSSYCAEAENILYPRETLYSGDSLTYGYNYFFRMQCDCNLVLYEGEIPHWASNTGGLGQNCYCNATSDGHLVIYNSDGRRIWISNSSSTPSNADQTYLLILQKDRDAVLYGPAISATHTNVRPARTFKRLGCARRPARKLAAANDADMIDDTNTLYSGETLNTNQSLAYGKDYRLIMQSNCNLVLYDTGNVVWESGTGDQASNCSCTLLTNGTLVIVTPTGHRIWRSTGSTGDEGNYLLVLQWDRNVVIYGPSVWTTNTSKTQTAAALMEGSVAAARMEGSVAAA